MADQTDVLIQQWLSRWEQIRHSENQRATTTNMILVLTALGLGFIAQRGAKPEMLVVSGTIMLVGVFGVLLSIKYYERFRLHLREAGAIRARIDEKYPELGITALVQSSFDDHVREYPHLAKMPLHGLWIALHAGIVCIGALLSVIIIAHL